tara:strand:+ start:125229 stop:126218 length:990 start_codon:yes stop_codon:yes gene_type:complete
MNLNKFLKILNLTSLCLVLAFAWLPNKSYSQNLVNDISAPLALGDSAELFTETIRIISRSQKIFIITNTNQMLYKGDFITIVLNEREAVARALVGKTYDGSAGIKILKIYSLKNWAILKKGLDVQILKGDDSRLFVKKKTVETTPEEESIESEEDLYKAEIDEDFDSFNRDNRLIKPDNIVSAGYAQYRFENSITGDTLAENQFNFTWAYQFSDNFWFEGLYGRALFEGFPVQGTSTLISNFTFRVKYTLKAPFYSYIMPYLGYQIYQVSSPNAGEDPTTAAEEEQIINDLSKRQFIGGATLLKRLVPGWFLRGDIGNDILAVGFAIEF